MLQKEIDAVGDAQALVPEIDQKSRLAARRKQDLEAFIAHHIAEILRELRREGEAIAAGVNAKAEEFLAVLDNYLGFHGRVTGIVAAARGNVREIAGLDAAADLKRTIERVDLPAPIGDSR